MELPHFLNKSHSTKQEAERFLRQELPKYAVRVDKGHEHRAFAPGIHMLADCGAYENQRTSLRRYEPLRDDIMIRHYRCMNHRSPCEKTEEGRRRVDPAMREWGWWEVV